jgi:hypothetical protein
VKDVLVVLLSVSLISFHFKEVIVVNRKTNKAYLILENWYEKLSDGKQLHLYTFSINQVTNEITLDSERIILKEPSRNVRKFCLIIAQHVSMNVFVQGSKLNENRNELYVHLNGPKFENFIYSIDLNTFEEKIFLRTKATFERERLYFDQKRETWEYLQTDLPMIFGVIERSTRRAQNTTNITPRNNYRFYGHYLRKDESNGVLYWNGLYFDIPHFRKGLIRKFLINYEDLEKSRSQNLDDRFKVDWNDVELLMVEDNVMYFRGYQKRNIFGLDIDTGALVYETKVPNMNGLTIVKDYFIPKTESIKLVKVGKV